MAQAEHNRIQRQRQVNEVNRKHTLDMIKGSKSAVHHYNDLSRSQVKHFLTAGNADVIAMRLKESENKM